MRCNLLVKALLVFVSVSALACTARAASCMAPPAGLVGWWRGDASTTDEVSLAPGTRVGDAGYTAGFVGSAFRFDGDGDSIRVGNPAALQLQNFTIECWLRRAETGRVNGAGWLGMIFSYGTGGYGLYLDPSGTPTLTHVEYSNVADNRQITNTNYHHVAVTKADSKVVFYIDGVPYTALAYNPTFSFSSEAQIGAWGNGTANSSFLGSIDEVSVYNRALTPEEVKAIYDASLWGKCFTPVAPAMVQQPTNMTVRVGKTATLSAVVAGTGPLAYQWHFDGTPLPGATTPTLTITNAQPAHQGTYTLTASNSVGTASSTGAVLTVRSPTSCTPVTFGAVSWWRAEGGFMDEIGTNHGIAVGDVKFVPGAVSSAFEFDGDRDSVRVGNPESLRLQDFTIETWLKRNSTSWVSSGGGLGLIFAYGTGGYGLYLDENGTPTLTHIEFSNVPASRSITDTDYHHVAVTKSGATVIFYIDGEALPASPYNPTFTFTSEAQIGAWGAGPNGSFLGQIDELAIYSRPLSAAEILDIYDAGFLGKCSTPVAARFFREPVNRTVFVGQEAAFSAVAVGTMPLRYQWSRDGVPLPGATNATLTIRNAQLSDAGDYTLVVTNDVGRASAMATLKINPLPPCAKPAAGLVGWWPANGNSVDQILGTDGMLKGGTVYGGGLAGQAFVFDGAEDAVEVGNPLHLQLQDFTIEAWVQRSSADAVTLSGPLGMIFGYGYNGYGFYLTTTGQPVLTKVGVSDVVCTAAITDTEFHHIAVTKSGSTVVFYIDGTPYPAPAPYAPGFTFTTKAQIGAWNMHGSFLGKIDELAIYNRALSAAEIGEVYAANAAGKCTVPTSAWILYQPSYRRIAVPTSATFSVSAGGTPPLSYQWLHEGAAIPGATNSALLLTNVTSAEAGFYSVAVSNQFGTAISSNALLTVVVLGPLLEDNFDPAPDPLQWSSLSSGVATNYGGAVSGEHALWFGGNGTRSLTTRRIATTNGGTIEFSLRLADGPAFPWEKVDLPQKGIVLEYSTNGAYSFWVMGQYDSSTYTNWTHISVAIPEAAKRPTAIFRWRQLGNALATSDHWALDNVRIDAQAKPPAFVEQPQPSTVIVGSTAEFTATLAGTPPFRYQWLYNGNPLPAGTNVTLRLTNVLFSDAGSYSLLVSNEVGFVSSSPAQLVVTPPWARIEVVGGPAASGGTVTVPISLTGNGNENAFGFSLAFNAGKLTFVGVAHAAATASGTLLVNTNDAPAGRVGVALSLPAGARLPAGKQDVLIATFRAGLFTNTTAVAIGFEDLPIPRQLADAQGNPLPAYYSSAGVYIAPAELEGDLAPRPTGDHALTITDWVLAGRFSALLDAPGSPEEFQRADCAPRSSSGDGVIGVTDWVQVGRYAARLDPLALAGGPTTSGGIAMRSARKLDTGDHRQLVLSEATVPAGADTTVFAHLRTLGDENAAGFTVQFDPAAITYMSAEPGKDAAGAALNVNSSQAGAGRVAVTVALQPGTAFAAGSHEVLKLKFRIAPSANGSYALSLVDQPVARQLSSASAESLSSEFVSGKLVVVAAPSLRIGLTTNQVSLAWPSWASNYLVQEASTLSVSGTGWTNIIGTPTTADGEIQVTVPVKGDAGFYRLKKP